MEPRVLAADASPSRRPLPAGLQAVLAEMRRDIPLLAAIAAYAVVVGALCLALGKLQFYRPFIYMPVWMGGLAVGFGVYAIVFELPPAVRADPGSPLSALVARLRRHATPQVAARVVLFAAVGVFTSVFSCMKSLNNDLVPFHADAMLADLDAWMHLGVDPWRFLQPLLGHQPVTRLIQMLYMNGWMLMLLGFVGLAVFSSRLAHVRTRFFAVYFAAWILLGNVMAAAFMSGGPVYYGALTGDHTRFAEQFSYLAFSDGIEGSSVMVQKGLWALFESGRVHLGSGISAFPSLHVAMTTLFTLTAFHISRWAALAAGSFGALILAGSVHLGWHYAVDGYVSAAVVAALWVGAGWIETRLKPAA